MLELQIQSKKKIQGLDARNEINLKDEPATRLTRDLLDTPLINYPSCFLQIFTKQEVQAAFTHTNTCSPVNKNLCSIFHIKNLRENMYTHIES